MLQLLLHAIGDYLVQNDWMALNKKKRTWLGELACQVHCGTYSIPFYLIYGCRIGMVVHISHYFIDRFNFVAYFIALKNWTVKVTGKTREDGLTYANINLDISNFGFSPERPQFISMWLYIITDNVIHVICNYLAITFIK